MQPTRCPAHLLLPDLLCEISCRIHDAGDFVRFHAVCKPWRQSYELAARKKATTHQFMPWLLAPNKDGSLRFTCVFTKSRYLAPPPISGTGKNWVASADGTAVRYFTADLTLTDPLTGDVTHLPVFPQGQWEEENPSGIIYDDDTVLVYSKYRNNEDETTEFRAASLCPGDDQWTVIHRTMESPYYGELNVAYHAGKIIITVDRRLWHVVATTTASDDVLVPTPCSMPVKYDGYFYEHGHLFESCGDLLWACVHMRTDYWKEYEQGAPDLARSLSVSVHVLEEAPHPRWVRKEGTTLANLVLFLGWPNSFSVDASRLGMNVGFAYFVHSDTKSGVYRYDLVNNTTEFIQWLSPRMAPPHVYMAHPQPNIVPICQGLATTPRSNNMIRIERPS